MGDAEWYAQPENLKEFASDLLGVNLHPNQLEWHGLLRKHNKMLIEAAVGHGKSTWLYPEVVQFICRSMMELKTGKSDKSPRILFVTGRESLAKKYGQRARESLELPAIKRLYGQYGVGKGYPWSDISFSVAGMPVDIKEPTWFASGPTGGIEGTRTNWAILDDFIDVEQALSPANRNSLWTWYTTTLSGRMDRDAKLTIIGSSWHPEDAYSKIRRQAEEEGSDIANYKYPCYKPDGGLLCPEEWTREDLEAKRADIGSSYFKLRYLMDHRALVGGMFDEKHLIFLDELPTPIEANYSGWDLAITSKEVADQKNLDPDYTAGIVVCWHPQHWDRIVVVDIYRERIRRGHADAINMMHTKHNTVMEVVEDNAFQRLVRDSVKEKYRNVNVSGVKNVKDKVARIRLGLESFFERGFYLYKGMGMEKIEWFLGEYTTFPRGAHEDILDALNNIVGKMHRGKGVKMIEHDGSW